MPAMPSATILTFTPKYRRPERTPVSPPQFPTDPAEIAAIRNGSRKHLKTLQFEFFRQQWAALFYRAATRWADDPEDAISMLLLGSTRPVNLLSLWRMAEASASDPDEETFLIVLRGMVASGEVLRFQSRDDWRDDIYTLPRRPVNGGTRPSRYLAPGEEPPAHLRPAPPPYFETAEDECTAFATAERRRIREAFEHSQEPAPGAA